MNYSFKNAIASLKDGARELDEQGLRNTRVYAKLMLAKGKRFGEIQSRAEFLTNEPKTFVRAELFVLNTNNQMVFDNRVFVNVNIDATIKADKTNRMYYVELEHPSLDISESEEVGF